MRGDAKPPCTPPENQSLRSSCTHQILSCSSILPHRVPHLTHARFLTVSGGIPPSSSSAIKASFRITHPDEEAARVLSYNRLQFLPFPDQLGSVQPSGDLRVHNELGYFMVCLLYSVHWYCVKYDESRGRPVLSYIGGQQFKSSLVASASWSSQLSGECLVLLENGEVFVFELNERHCSGFRGCKMKVSWEDYQGKCWLGCEFGWRLGTFIVARSDAVFVITRTSGSCCCVRALLESESLDMAGAEEFVAFAKAGSSDHSFGFLLAFRSYLYLCDQRSGVPLLKWQHDVEKLCFIDVYSLSDLGFRTDESTTSCVVVGSFWNAESQMFCYGPSPSVASDPSSLYVWELPHNLLSPAGKCLCGDCAIREVIMKESLPVWIDWQKKRVLVLGFGVLNKYLPSLSSSDGFTLIQLKSSGKLEALKFRSSPSLGGVVTHRDSTSDEVNLLYFPDDNIYKLPRRFKYLELDYLSAYTKGNLTKLLESRISKKRPSGGSKKKSDPLSLTYHEELCEKLNLCGFGRDRCSSTVTAVFDSINSPTSVFDIALRETWSSLPIELLLLAFSNYTEVEGTAFSFVETRVRPGIDLIGPVLPLPVLLTLHELRNGCVNLEQQELFSPDAEFAERCNQISKAASEMANSGAGETTIPLDDDMWLSQKEKKRDDDVVGGGRSGLEVLDDRFMCKALVSQWQDRSSSYQDFLSQYHLQK
ncbi:hypothetical protein DY000_02050076 [Brassica cretica]|uniref:Uncharacterized protein n=1 Tax=Brassica cretica TaxID=69181 RepID=A0ABQ7ETY0_BRACR|nr:hypothetical protein DY000_02050076 [Brassica cretica]